jgi:putative hemolysin
MHPVLRARDHMSTRDLLGEMRRRRQHLAVVEDQNGLMLGLVTIQDLIEDIVGEVQEDEAG